VARAGQREEKMKTLKDAMKSIHLTSKQDPFPIFHDEKRYAKILKNLDREQAKAHKALERLGADLSPIC
jgi:hypothetical protein